MTIFTAISSAIGLISSWTISLGALGSFAIGNFLLRAAVQLGVSALAKAFSSRDDGPQSAPFVIQGNVRTGGEVPRSFLIGPALTAGSLVYHTEWGSDGETPNAFYTQVIALSDLPVKGLKRWFIEGRAVTLEDNGHRFGLEAVEYRAGSVNHAWVRFHDGTQLNADELLIGEVNDRAPRIYSPSRVGRGIAYAVVTFRVNPKIFTGFPRSKFVLDGVKLYDISKDGTAGGTGAQRWDEPETWGGDGDDLPAVQAYNLARGIFYRDIGAGGAVEQDETITLSADHVTLGLKLVGGGGWGGGDTVAVLKDGGATVQTWVASGGGMGSTVSGDISDFPPYGNGGDGTPAVWSEPDRGGTYIVTPAINGGEAGEVVEVVAYDISGLTAPSLEITIGTGGAGGARDGLATYAAHLAPSAVVPQWFYGLQGLTAARLPAAHWVSQVEKCRAEIEGEDGLEPIYRCAGEITIDSEIGSAVEAVLTACAGRMSEVGGVFKLYVGAPDAAIASFDDGDIISTSPQTFTPFYGLSETVNGVVGVYPSPDEGYAMRATAPIYNAAYEAEDGNRRLLTRVQMPFVPFPAQAQRLLSGELAAARRARRHTHTLPARFRKIEPGDTVAFSSVRNGYTSKLFRVDGVIDLPNCDLIIDVTEVDPSDHGNWQHSTDYVPPVFVPIPSVPVYAGAQQVLGFDPIPQNVLDDGGNPRRPGILMQWSTAVDDVAGLIFEVRVKSSGQVVARVETRDFEAGSLLVVDGLVTFTDYEARAKYIPASERAVAWSPWVFTYTDAAPITADDLAPDAVGWSNLAQAVRDTINASGDGSAAAASAAQSAADADAAKIAAETFATAADVAKQAAEAAEGGAVAAQGLAVDARDAAIAMAGALLPAEIIAADHWSTATQSADAYPKAAVNPAFLVSDADLGNALEAAGVNRSFGPAAAVDFDRSRSYLVTVHVKCVDDGTLGGVRVQGGFSTYSAGGTVAHQVNVQSLITDNLTVSDGVAVFRFLIKPDTLTDLGTFTDFDGSTNHGAQSDPATAISPHVRFNGSNATDGTGLLGFFEVSDITSALAANISAKASYDASQAALAHSDDAASSASASEASRVAAETANTAAGSSASAAASSASTAQASETAAGQSASAASASKVAAETAAGQSASSASAAASSASAASASETAAGQSASAANSSKVAANTAAGGASASQTAAAASASNASDSASAAALSASVASQTLTQFRLEHTDFQRVLDGVAALDAVGGLETASDGGAILGQAGSVISETGSGTISSSGTTNGLRIEIPQEQALQFSGRRVRVDILAQPPGSNAAARFVAAYSTDDVGNSGAQGFDLGAGVGWHSFHYDVPAASNGGPDYIGLWGDEAGTGKATQFVRVVVRLAPLAADIPELGVALASASSNAQAITDINGNAEASFVFRAKANGAAGAVEIVAAHDAVNGPASKITLTADEIGFDGIAIFTNGLRSDDYVPGSAGFKLDKDGLEFNGQIVRDAIVDGAVSNGGVYTTAATATEKSHDVGLGALVLGPFSIEEFWQMSFRFEYRDAGSYIQYVLKQETPTLEYYRLTGRIRTRIKAQYAVWSGGAWGDWLDLHDFGLSDTAWLPRTQVVSDHDDRENTRLRLLVLHENLQTSSTIQTFDGGSQVSTQTNVRNVSYVARALVK